MKIEEKLKQHHEDSSIYSISSKKTKNLLDENFFEKKTEEKSLHLVDNKHSCVEGSLEIIPDS